MLRMKKVELLPNSLVSGVMSFLSETQDAPICSLSNKQFLEAYKGLIAQKRLSYTDPGAEASEYRRIECLQFDPSVDFAEKNLSRFPNVKELQFLNGFKHAYNILSYKILPRDNITQISLAAPGLLMGDSDSFYLLKFPRLRRLEVLGSNKHQPKKLSELLQNLCIFTKLLYLRLDSFPLDGSIKVPYSLTLKHLRMDLVGSFFDFNLLNIFFPALQELELYYSQDPSGHPVTGTLRVLNFPSLKELTLKNLRPLSNAVRDPFAEKFHFFSPFEGKKWNTVTQLSIDFLTMASFGALNETFENISIFNIVVGTMDFQMLPGKTTESLPHQATSVTIEAQKFGLVDLYDPNPFYEHVTHLILKLEEFDIRTLSMLTTLECLKDLSLILVKLSDGSFSLDHPGLAEDEEIQPDANASSDDNLILVDSYPPSDNDESIFSADFDGTFETLEVLRVTYPSRMHQFIVWITTQSPYLHTIISSESLHPITEKICLAQAPSLSIHIH